MILQIVKQWENIDRFSLTSQGESMMPILQPNDTVYYKKILFIQTRVNDLVLIRKENNLLTHRIIYKTKKYAVTKGDYNQKSDGKIFQKNIYGKVVKVKRAGKLIDPEHYYDLQSALYFQEIISFKHQLEQKNIEVVFLKGLPLHLYYEKSYPRRNYFDCDILIKQEDMKRVAMIIKKLGYRKIQETFFTRQEKIKDKATETSYFKSIHNIFVVFDIHFEIVFMMTQLGKLEALYPQRLINEFTEKCIREKRKIKIYNEPFFILNPPNLIIYLALHFFHHNFTGIYMLDLLDKVMRHEKKAHLQNTEKIIRYFRLGTFIYPTFVLLKKYFSTPISIKLINKEYKISIKRSVFDSETRIQAGMQRFKNIFFLSPEPLYKKMLIFINPQVIFSSGWLLYKGILKIFQKNEK